MISVRNFHLSTLSLAIGLALFGQTTVHAATATLYGDVTVDGKVITTTSAPDLVVGETGSVVKVLVTDPNAKKKNAVVMDGGSLTMLGSDITVTGVLRGIYAKPCLGIVSTTPASVTIGDDQTQKLTLTAGAGSVSPHGVYAEQSTVNLSAAELKVVAQASAKNSNAVGLVATANANLAVGGEANRTVHISASDCLSSPTKSTAATSAVHLKNGATVDIGSAGTQTVEISATSMHQGSALYAQATSGKNVLNVTGSSIVISAEAQTVAKGIDAGKGAEVTIGSRNAQSVSITGTKTGEDAAGADEQAYGIFNVNQAKTQVIGKTITIAAKGAKDTRAIHVANNTESRDQPAELTIEGDSVYITAESDNPDHATVGISTMSFGQVLISGNTVVTAKDAIVTRGDAVVSINADGNHYTQINGNIDFNYDNESSGTGVDAQVTLNLAGENSHWNGSPLLSYGTGKPSEDKTKITGLHVTLSDGAQWTPVHIVDTTYDEQHGELGVALNNLVMNDGVINVNDGAKQRVAVDNLKGSGGTINVKASTVDGKTFESGTLAIGKVDASQTDAPSLTVRYTGVSADDVKDQEAALDALNSTVTVTDTSTSVSKTNVIEEGAVMGAISQEVAADGTKGEVTQTENAKLSAFGSVAALTAFQWRHDMNDLTKRMGELRSSPEGIGAWVRLYGSEQEYGAQHVEAKNTSIQVGSDFDVGGWKVGAAFTYTDGDASYAEGSADNKAYGVGVYGTWLAENGQFVDLIAKFSRLNTDFELNGMNGGFDNNAYSVSAEYGWHLRLGQNGFVEPQAELTYGQVLGATFTTGNNVKVEQKDFDSLIGRIGMRGGFHFPKEKGVIYARASVLHDFKGESEAVASLVTDASVRSGIKDDLGGTWCEFGVGANFNVTDNAYAYVDLEKTAGGEVKENWRWNAGVRLVW